MLLDRVAVVWYYLRTNVHTCQAGTSRSRAHRPRLAHRPVGALRSGGPGAASEDAGDASEGGDSAASRGSDPAAGRRDGPASRLLLLGGLHSRARLRAP